METKLENTIKIITSLLKNEYEDIGTLNEHERNDIIKKITLKVEQFHNQPLKISPELISDHNPNRKHMEALDVLCLHYHTFVTIRSQVYLYITSKCERDNFSPPSFIGNRGQL